MVLDMRLAGICKECRQKLGVDDRLTIPLQFVQVSQLSEYNAKSLAGVQFAGTAHAFARAGQHGTTKITYKIAKTVKETIDDATSHASQTSHRSKP